jgi:hypothetical protein
MTPPRSSPRIIADKEKAQQAIELRKAGANYEQIAAQLGYATRGSAQRAVKRLLQANAAEAVEDLRTLEDGRLDDMLSAIYKAAKDGDLPTIDRVLRIAERRAKLWGLDAPAQVQNTNVEEITVVFADAAPTETDTAPDAD